MGWVGMVKIASRWFSNSVYGAAMGAISLSYLFGDAASRKFMAYLIEHHMTWQEVFFTASGVLAVTFVITLFFLKESPVELGLPEPEAGNDTLFIEDGGETHPPGLGELLRPFLVSPVFWCVCLISLGFTLIRETFNTWTPTYFQQVVGMTKAQAAAQSAYFPLWGGVSVLIAGFLSDKLGKGGRAAIIAIGIALSGLLMFRLGHIASTNATTAAFLVSCIAFLMLGPYSYLAGAIALDFGGKKGSATACGIIDGVGYLAGILAGDSVARISVKYGWQGAFTALSGVAALSCLAALAFWFFQKRARKPDERGTP
jgi:OPA family glycerol-3-phosphate transporter-like MFS transporter